MPTVWSLPIDCHIHWDTEISELGYLFCGQHSLSLNVLTALLGEVTCLLNIIITLPCGQTLLHYGLILLIVGLILLLKELIMLIVEQILLTERL